MADSTTRGRAADRKRLNKSEPYEVAYAKSDRASPERKAMLADGGSSSKKRSASAGKKSSGAAKSRGASAKKSATAKKSAGARKSASGSGARKSSSGSARKSTTGSARKSTTGSARKSASGSARKSTSGSARKSASGSARKSTSGAGARKSSSSRPSPKPPKAEKTAENTAPKTMREPDAVDLLTDDHLQVSALFKRYVKLAKKKAPAGERRTLAESICAMLKAHTTIEEEIFYPAARRAGIDDDMLDEAKVEHASSKDLIAQIESSDAKDDLYDAKVTVLGEYIQHHVVEEQNEMFPKCRRSGMDLVALRGELETRKQSILPAGADGAAVDGSAASASEDESPGVLAMLSDKFFSSETGTVQRGRAPGG
jgi:hypothetical protein